MGLPTFLSQVGKDFGMFDFLASWRNNRSRMRTLHFPHQKPFHRTYLLLPHLEHLYADKTPTGTLDF